MEDTSTAAPQKAEVEELKYESRSQEGGSLELSVKIKKPEKPKDDED